MTLQKLNKLISNKDNKLNKDITFITDGDDDVIEGLIFFAQVVDTLYNEILREFVPYASSQKFRGEMRKFDIWVFSEFANYSKYKNQIRSACDN